MYRDPDRVVRPRLRSEVTAFFAAAGQNLPKNRKKLFSCSRRASHGRAGKRGFVKWTAKCQPSEHKLPSPDFPSAGGAARAAGQSNTWRALQRRACAPKTTVFGSDSARAGHVGRTVPLPLPSSLPPRSSQRS